jgi:hypothetical protein
MNEGKGLRIGRYISRGVLIVFGIAVIALGVWGFNFTRDHTKRQGSDSGRSKTRRSRSMLPTPANSACSRPRVAFTANRVWSIYGADRAQLGGNRSQMGQPRKRHKQAETVATGCDQLPIGAHGKEGVSGSSPEEGSEKAPHIGAFLPKEPAQSPACSGYGVGMELL